MQSAPPFDRNRFPIGAQLAKARPNWPRVGQASSTSRVGPRASGKIGRARVGGLGRTVTVQPHDAARHRPVPCELDGAHHGARLLAQRPRSIARGRGLRSEQLVRRHTMRMYCTVNRRVVQLRSQRVRELQGRCMWAGVVSMWSTWVLFDLLRTKSLVCGTLRASCTTRGVRRYGRDAPPR